ncbi:MAG: hypothetical protein SWY16_18425 [Cyanobacteriota bacterium]|nr:hypothetical protein [Cyanobacteriota bacterium]
MKSYQLIEALKQRPWRSQEYNPSGNRLWTVPSMLIDEEKKMLSYITQYVFEGKGHILDLGCSIGGSTAFLSHGLSNNSYSNYWKIHSFDLFQVGNYERKTFFPLHNIEIPADSNMFPLFQKHTAPWSQLIEVHAGNILDYAWSGESIEILFVDIMKSAELYDYVIETFFPCLIPGESIIILQDYLFVSSGPWHIVLMELLKDKITRISHTAINSVIYLCTDRITQEDIENCKWDNISHSKKGESIARAAVNWDSENQEILFKILSRYVEGSYEGWGKHFNTALRQEKDIEKSI